MQNGSSADPLLLASGYSGTGQIRTAITSTSVHDEINVTGTATLTGSPLALSPSVSFTPANGQVFTIPNCTTACSSPFSSVSGATLANGSSYRVGYTATSVTLTFETSSPLPTVSGVSPNTGPTAGVTSVTIPGTGFTGGTSVVFGDRGQEPGRGE